MLHRLTLPNRIAAHLRWIVELQERALIWVCDPAMNVAEVNVENLLRLWSDAPAEWVETTGTRKVDGGTFLEALTQIASAPVRARARLLADFQSDLGLANAYQPGVLSFRLRGNRGCGGNTTLEAAMKSMFLRFYGPLFDPSEGFPRRGATLRGRLRRPHFVAAVLKASDLAVCPYCDGPLTRSTAQLDHFFPKAARSGLQFPALAISPDNLVPACKNCNSAQRKGEQVHLALTSPNQVARRFHPYHRSAEGLVTVRFRPPREHNIPRRVELRATTAANRCEVQHLDTLLGVSAYWTELLGKHVDSAVATLRRLRRNKGTLTAPEIQAKLAEWADEADDGMRKTDFAFLKRALFQAAAAQDPQFWPEFWSVAA